LGARPSGRGTAMMRRSRFRVAALFTLAAMTAGSRGAMAYDMPGGGGIDVPRYEVGHVGFPAGESLYYRVAWNGIPAAEAELRLDKVVAEGGLECYRAVATAKTKKYIDWIYRMRARVEALFAVEAFEPVRFAIHQTERKKKIRTLVEFDQEQDQVLSTKTSGKRVKKRSFPLANGFDPVSMVYLIRTLPLEPGGVWKFYLLEGSHGHILTLEVVGRERIKVPAGKFEALRIKPSIEQVIPKKRDPKKTGKKEEEIRQVSLWISDDPSHKLLKMKSEVSVGSVSVSVADAGEEAGR
ncbi:DUF3108 domain-containing protein, partial [Thermodesulfobacteriota bacterium]